MIEKPVVFKNDRGQQLVGMLHLPKARGGKRFPAVIICHGWGGTKIGLCRRYVILSRKLAKKGIAVLRYDTWGHGDSAGDFASHTTTQAVKDLDCALRFIKNVQVVDTKCIGLLGHSRGGQLVLERASKDEKIRTVVGLAPLINRKWLAKESRYPDIEVIAYWKKRGYHIATWGELFKTSYWKDAHKYRTQDVLKNIKCPVLLVHGSKDTTVDVRSSKEAIGELPPLSRLEIVGGADHNFSNPTHNIELLNMMTGWFSRWLKP